MNINDLYHAFLKRWWHLTATPRLRLYGVRLGNKVTLYGMPRISLVEGADIFIGDKVVLASHRAFTALGVSRPCILCTLRKGARITVGSNSGLSGVAICAAQSVSIGKDCLLGADVIISDTDFHAVKADGRRYNTNQEDIGASPVIIEDNVFIGARVTILKGVSIGKNSVVGAGAVVTRDIPGNCVAAGNPAIVLRHLQPMEP